MAEVEDDGRITVLGVTANAEQLTFRERRAAREIADEVAVADEADQDDMLIGIITVLARRTEPEFTVEQAMDMTPEQLLPPKPPEDAPPTKRPATRKRSTP